MALNTFFLVVITCLIYSSVDGVEVIEEKISDWFFPSYELDGKEICLHLQTDPRVLILVASSPHKEETRDAIRYTWGSYAHRRDLALGFVLGKPNATEAKNITREAKFHDDLIIGNFIDSYYNMTLKTLTMLDWAEKFCPNAKFLLKIDEDVFLNPQVLLNITRSNLNASNTIWGNIVYYSTPIRSKNYSNFVSAEEYPAPIFPTFASGPVYLMTSGCISPLKQSAMSSRFVRLEDVFITGISATKAGIPRVFQKEFTYSEDPFNSCSPFNKVAVHNVLPKYQYDTWKRVKQGSLYCPPHAFH